VGPVNEVAVVGTPADHLVNGEITVIGAQGAFQHPVFTRIASSTGWTQSLRPPRMSTCAYMSTRG